MSRKHFGLEVKKKYITLINSKGFERATIAFVCEFESRYQDYWEKQTGFHKKYKSPANLARSRLRNWLKKYNSFGNDGLINMTGKDKNKNSGRKLKISINELNEHDRELYQEIMESLIKEKGIKPSDIQKEIKKRKKEGKSFSNHKEACEILGINRTSVYTNYAIKEKNIISPIKRLWVKGLTEWMCMKIIESDYTIGRDKLYKTYCKTKGHLVKTYVFRVHFEAISYKSRAYIRKGDNPPKEKKYKGIYCKDKIDFKYNSDFLHEKWFSDITYIKLKDGWWHLNAIIESFGNNVLAWKLQKTSTGKDAIKLLEIALSKSSRTPNYFHTDHGVEYANKYVTNFLKENNIEQSMSPKGNSLANRPSEFFWALIKREKLHLYDLEQMDSLKVETLIKEYLKWYHYGRIQNNLQNKTPMQFIR